MVVHDGTMGDQEGRQGTTATEGGRRSQGGEECGGARQRQRHCHWTWGSLRGLYYNRFGEAGEGTSMPTSM
jgi:hypothetical protein